MIYSIEDIRKEKRLLVVAENARLVNVSVAFYLRRGYKAQGATNSAELLSALNRFSPQVILMSVHVAEKSSLELIREIKLIDKDCNILLFTRNEDPEIIKEAWRSGAFFFLREGATPSQILPEVERAFEDYFNRLEIKYLRKFVFVLMPFSEDFTDVYHLGIKPAIEDSGLFCQRVDEQHFTDSILERVLANIKFARFIVAEMTGKNPNVFYEVGYAHALGKPVIFLTQNSEDIPFDLKDKPHIVYGGKIFLLKQMLGERLKGLLQQERENEGAARR
jgi:CheY-like chemotaxis protein